MVTQAAMRPTPVANDDNKSLEAHLAMKKRIGERDGTLSNRTAVTSLNVLATNWPTPSATDHKGGQPGQRRGQLSEAAEHKWPTPQATDWVGAGNPPGRIRDGKIRTSGDDDLPSRALQWPTPNVPNGGRVMAEKDVLNKGMTERGKRQVPLEQTAKLWPTPRSSPNENRTTHHSPSHGKSHGATLAGTACHFLPDPDAGSKSDVLTAESFGSLKTQMLRHGVEFLESDGTWPPLYRENSSFHPEKWPTPNAERATGYLSGSGRDTWRPTLDGMAEGATPVFKSREKQRPQTGLKLNPLFVEWLQNLPIGWTDLGL